MGCSSSGKSTSQRVAAAIWDFVETLLSWRSTDNALEALLALHSDNLLILDEISQAPDKAVSEIVYMAGNGRGKARMRSDATIKATQTWRAMLLSSGEMKVSTRIEAAGRKSQAGQDVRLVDIPADAGAGLGAFENLHGYANSNVFSIALKDAARANCGHAGRAFLEYLTKNMDKVKEDISASLSAIEKNLCPAESDGQVQRVARRFALCMYAGMLAAEAALFGEDKDAAAADVSESIKKCFKAWIDDRGGIQAGEDTNIIHDVARFFEQYGESSFRPMKKDGYNKCWKSDPDVKILRQYGYRSPDERFYLVMPESFKQEVCHGHDYKRAARVLRGKGYLVPEPGKVDRNTYRLEIDEEQKTGYRIRFSIASGMATDPQGEGES